MKASSKRLLATGVGFLLLVAMALLAIAIRRSLQGSKEGEQFYLLLGMLFAPLVPVLCLRVRRLGLVLAVAMTLLAFFGFAAGFFYYMDQHGPLPAEPCVGEGVGFDEWDCRGHYGFENELLVPHLWVAGIVGALLALGGKFAVGRFSRRRNNATRDGCAAQLSGSSSRPH